MTRRAAVLLATCVLLVSAVAWIGSSYAEPSGDSSCGPAYRVAEWGSGSDCSEAMVLRVAMIASLVVCGVLVVRSRRDERRLATTCLVASALAFVLLLVNEGGREDGLFAIQTTLGSADRYGS